MYMYDTIEVFISMDSQTHLLNYQNEKGLSLHVSIRDSATCKYVCIEMTISLIIGNLEAAVLINRSLVRFSYMIEVFCRSRTSCKMYLSNIC